MSDVVKHNYNSNSLYVSDLDALKVADRFSVVEEGRQVLIDRLPTPEERKLLKRREDDLKRALRPISYASEDQKRVAQMLATMFAGYPTMRNTNPQDTIAAYVVHLKDLPLFAIKETCEAVIKNKVKHFATDLPPPANLLYEDAEYRASKVHMEQLRFSRILQATELLQPVISEAERERVNLAIEAWRASSAKAFQGEVEERERRIDRTLQHFADRNDDKIAEDYRRHGEEPQKSGDVLISRSLRDNLKNL